MSSQGIIEIIALGVISSLILWLLKRQSDTQKILIQVVTRMEYIKDILKDVKEHEKRITILEPKADAAHRRIDEIASRH